MLFNRFPSLESKRLYLRQVVPEDVKQLYLMNMDPDIIRNVHEGRRYDFDDTIATITDFYPTLFRNKECVTWGLALKENNKLIGIRMCFVDSIHEPVTIQGQVLKECRGKGYTTEAYIEIIKLLKKAGVNGIKANADKNNTGAIQLFKKLGFKEVYTGIRYSFLDPKPDTILFEKDLNVETSILVANAMKAPQEGIKSTVSIGNKQKFSGTDLLAMFGFNSKKSSPNESVEEAIETCKNHLKKRNPALALECINKAIEDNPNSSEAYVQKGIVTRTMEGNIAALHTFYKALELNPKNAKAYTEIGICNYNISCRTDAHENWATAVSLGDLRAAEFIEKYPK